MKTLTKLFAVTIIVLFFSTETSFARGSAAGDTLNKPDCLEIIGIAVDQKDIPLDGAIVKLYKENDEQEWTEITSVVYHEHSFEFRLTKNEYYTIEVSKPGYVTRSIGISTYLPDGVKTDVLFRYEFEVSMFKQKPNVDDYYLDFPVALISYDAKNDVFDNHNAYTNHIKAQIKAASNNASTVKTIGNDKKSN